MLMLLVWPTLIIIILVVRIIYGIIITIKLIHIFVSYYKVMNPASMIKKLINVQMLVQLTYIVVNIKELINWLV